MGATLRLQVSAIAGSQNVAANTSRIAVTLDIVTNLGTWSHDGTTDGSITIDGQQVVSLKGKWVDMNTTTRLYTGEHTITHNIDGSASVTVKAAFDMNTATRWIYAQQALTLPTIPRPSTISAPAMTLGQPGVLTVGRKDESFTHTVTYTLGTASGTICTKSADTRLTWTPPLSLANALPLSAEGEGTLTIVTYSGGQEVGRATAPFTVHVPPELVPTVETFTVTIENSDPVLSGWGVAAAGKSRLAYTVAATSVYGAQPALCTFTAAGETITGFQGTTGVLTAAGSVTPKVTVRDTRGRTAQAEGEAITVHPYDPPTIQESAAVRCDAQGNPNDAGSYLHVLCRAACASLAGHNSVTVRLRSRRSGGDWSGYTALTNGAAQVLPGFDADTSYEVELSAVDALGAEKTVVYPVATEQVAFKLADGGRGAGFGKHPEGEGLDMAWPIAMNGNPITGLPQPTAEDEPVTLGALPGLLPPQPELPEIPAMPLMENTVRYVSPSGSDENDGLTADAPMATIQAALDSIPRDMGGCTATIYLRGGSINAGSGYSIYDTAHYNGYLIFDGSGQSGGAVLTGDVFLGGRNMAYRLYKLSIKGNQAYTYGVINFGDCVAGEVSGCTVDGVTRITNRAGIRTLYSANMVVYGCTIKNCDTAVSTWMLSMDRRSSCMVQVRSCTGSNNRLGIYALTALVMSIDNALGATTAQLVSAGGQIFT